MKQQAPQEIDFMATLYALKDWLILPIPAQQSIRLPSRGQVSVDLSINGHKLSTVVEPDGRGSHWLRVSDALQRKLEVGEGDQVEVHVRTNSHWPEPTVPRDVNVALKNASNTVHDKWRNITPMARWEWIRWIHATSSENTRMIRIEKTISKLEGSHRRPCCFNLAACTEIYVARNSRLIEPTE